MMHPGISELFSKTRVDLVLLRSFPNALDPNFAYFSGLSQRHYNSNLLVLQKAKKPLVFCSPLEAASARQHKSIHVVELKTKKAFDTFTKHKIKDKTIGINFEYYPQSSFRALQKLKPKKIVNIDNTLCELRAIKTKTEIKHIQKAVRVSEQILDSVPDLFSRNMTEKKLAQELHIQTIQSEADELAFPTIVASGANAAVPHHVCSNQKIGNNRFLLVDFGVKWNNYCADLSRTFFVGNATEQDRWAYWVVWTAQQRAFNKIKPDSLASEPFHAADHILFNAFGIHLPHALGHGLGIKEHDFPTRMAPNELWPIAPNHVLTIEPGVYFPRRFGIRIEDDVVVTKKGARWLSKAPKKLIEIK